MDMHYHYHAWIYDRAKDGKLRPLELEDRDYPTPGQARMALTDGRTRWKSGRVDRCVLGAYCQSLPVEIFVNTLPFGRKYIFLHELEAGIRSTNSSEKRILVMRLRDELHAAGFFRSIEEVSAELRRAERDAEADRFLRENLGGQGSSGRQAPQKDPWSIPPPPGS